MYNPRIHHLTMISPRLGKSQALHLFATVAFPVHFWAILIYILSSPNVSQLKAITTAFGRGSYILLFALFESAIVFLFFVILSFLFPKTWRQNKVLSVLLSFFWLAVFWSLVANSQGLLTKSYDAFLGTGGISLLNISTDIDDIVLGTIVILAIISVVVAFQVGKNEKFEQILLTFSERIKPITYLYLFMDGVALVVALSRNVG